MQDLGRAADDAGKRDPGQQAGDEEHAIAMRGLDPGQARAHELREDHEEHRDQQQRMGHCPDDTEHRAGVAIREFLARQAQQ